MSNDELMRCPFSGEVYYVYKDTEGNLINLSYENEEHYKKVEPFDPGYGYCRDNQVTILCFHSVSEASFMKEKLVELYPDYADMVSALDITWLTKSDFSKGDYAFDYYPDACY